MTSARSPSSVFIKIDNSVSNINSFKSPFVQLKNLNNGSPQRRRQYNETTSYVEELEKLTLSGMNCKSIVQGMLADPYYQMLADNSKKPQKLH